MSILFIVIFIEYYYYLRPFDYSITDLRYVSAAVNLTCCRQNTKKQTEAIKNESKTQRKNIRQTCIRNI